MKREPSIPVFRQTLKRVKAKDHGDAVTYSLDRRSILNIVNRKAKKPAHPARASERPA